MEGGFDLNAEGALDRVTEGDGSELGINEGVAEGTILGFNDGVKLGVMLGFNDGSELGVVEGVVEGTVLVFNDGFKLGVMLGDKVGLGSSHVMVILYFPYSINGSHSIFTKYFPESRFFVRTALSPQLTELVL